VYEHNCKVSVPYACELKIWVGVCACFVVWYVQCPQMKSFLAIQRNQHTYVGVSVAVVVLVLVLAVAGPCTGVICLSVSAAVVVVPVAVVAVPVAVVAVLDVAVAVLAAIVAFPAMVEAVFAAVMYGVWGK